MRTTILIQVWLLMALSLSLSISAGGIQSNSIQSNGYGPEVKSFLDLMRYEEDELEYQIRRNEITRLEYIRSKNENAIHRQAVLNRVKETGADYVPELHVPADAQ